ncbi:hypothetical protein F6Y05_39745 [Bacillus megaterium]|nr:hypothetical protein [Priestia megaterium]
MRVAVKKIFEVEQRKGKEYFEVKTALFKAKKEGSLFFPNDVSSLTEQEDIDIYYSEFPGMDANRNAFSCTGRKLFST